jgi:methyl-accepting chemotaxis protein
MAKELMDYSKNANSNQTEKENYNLLLKDITKYKSTVSQVESLLNDNNYSQAVDLLVESNTLSKDLNSKIVKAFSYNIDKAQQRNNVSTVIFVIAAIAIVAFTVFFVLLILKKSKRIAAGITEPINKMVKAAELIADGNFNVDLSVKTSDETAKLALYFRRIVDSLQLMNTDIQLMIQEALAGRLETRVDAKKQKGAYRDIVEGVNKMFDTIKEPLDVASDFIDRLADGEKQTDIENPYQGYYAVLIDNLNRVNASVEILVKESEKLAQAGRNGQLDIRGDEGKLRGVYAEIISGVNDTFNAIKEPLDISSEFISNLAEGKGQDNIKNIYKGYYSALIDDLNKVNTSFSYMLCEVEKLIQAVQCGNLNIRGDTGVLKGDFYALIDGFNMTLDSIVLPLNEANKVLEKIAVNDYTTEMTGIYSGMLKGLAVSINCVRKQLLSLEKVITEVGKGNFDSLGILQETGKLSANDNIIPSVIAMLKAIQNLIKESNMLAAAAVEGDLTKRGEEVKFDGGYRDIVCGMNKTMAAFMSPIIAISKIIDSIRQKRTIREYRREK